MDAAPTLHGRSMPQAPLPLPPQSVLERPRMEPSGMDKASKNLPGWALFLVLAVIIGVALLAWYLFPSR
jgi:hypothetical protein